jgi:MoaA/NifB/PqqE/SkfB family radical SAM enzyme
VTPEQLKASKPDKDYIKTVVKIQRDITKEIQKESILAITKPYVYNKVQKYGMRIVRLEYDYICNFHCQHCDIKEYQGKSTRRALTVDDVSTLAKQADELGFAQFVISGGEPLVYPELDKIIDAIDPDKFYITVDSNGWLLDDEFGESLRAMGVDKVQISIDSHYAVIHDAFRNKSGSLEKAIEAVGHSIAQGLNVIVQTVVDKGRVHSYELIKFLDGWNSINVPVYIGYAKPVGLWKDHEMLSQDDIDYVESLCKKYNAFSHLTPTGECIAMKRMINITKWGDVNPCPVMQEYSIGNIFSEPLKDIVARGDKQFSGHIPTCPMAVEKDYINKLDAIR